MHAPQVPSLTKVSADYRPDIDGLRAVAVLSVLAFHYGAPLSGGFTGVDVFFVISGFLITSKLNDDIRAGLPLPGLLLGFYDRRVRRIVPALLFMLAVTLIAGWFLLMPGDYRSMAVSAAAASFPVGLSNFYFLWFAGGYFDPSVKMLPLLHTWSLGVEEQFYLVWPLLLLGITGLFRKRTSWALGAFVVVGFAMSLVWFDHDKQGAFYYPLPRAWELAIGALLVFLPPLRRFIGLATIAGLILIVVGFLFAREASFPGKMALFPCVGAALVIWPRTEKADPARWLGCLPMRSIGKISYSLYLWHWPIWVLYRIYINGDVPGIPETLLLAAGSVAAATFSYFVIEPRRYVQWRSAISFSVGLFACFVVLGGAVIVAQNDGFQERISPDAYAMRSRETMWKWECPQHVTLADKTYCAFGAPWAASRKGILWGDSHAQHLAPFLDVVAKQRGVSVILEGDCPAALGGHIQRRWPENPSYAYDCSNVRKTMLSILASQPIEFVVLASAWHTLGSDDIYSDDGRTGDKIELIRSGLADTIADIALPSRKVTVITNMTGPAANLTECVIANSSGLLRRPCPAPQTRIDSRITRSMFSPTNRVLDRLVGVNMIRPVDLMCSETDCLTRINGEFLWMDYSHLRRNLSDRTNADLSRVLHLESAFR